MGRRELVCLVARFPRGSSVYIFHIELIIRKIYSLFSKISREYIFLRFDENRRQVSRKRMNVLGYNLWGMYLYRNRLGKSIVQSLGILLGRWGCVILRFLLGREISVRVNVHVYDHELIRLVSRELGQEWTTSSSAESWMQSRASFGLFLIVCTNACAAVILKETGTMLSLVFKLNA